MKRIAEQLKQWATAFAGWLKALPARAKTIGMRPVRGIVHWCRCLTSKGRRQWIALCGLIVVAGVVWGGYSIISSQDLLSDDALDAVQIDNTYLADNGNLLIYTDGRVDLAYLRSNLKTADSRVLSVSKITDRVYSVRFHQLPKRGDILQMILHSPRGSAAARNFPVQVGTPQPVGKLQVRLICVGSANNVDIYAPVLLHFSQPIPQEQLEENLQLSAGVKIKVRMVENVAILQPQAPLEYSKRYSVSVSGGLEVDGETLQNTFSSEFMTASAPSVYTELLQDIGFAQPTVAPVSSLEVKHLQSGSDIAFDPRGSFTLVFSDAVQADTLYNYLTISPPIPAPLVEYTIDVQDNVAIVQPVVPLEFDQRYTLSIHKGMESVNGERLEERFELDIVTPASSLRLSLTNQASNVVDVASPLTLEFALENRKADYQMIELTLYRMNNYQQYRTVLSLAQIEQDFSLLELSHNTHVLRNGLNKVELENPGKGIYLIKAVTTDPETGLPLEFYKCLNVTDLTVYLQTANKRTLVWVNRTDSSAIPSGLEVELTDRTSYQVLATGTTGADGSCELTYESALPQEITEKQGDGVLTIYNTQGEVIYADTTGSIAPGSETPNDLPRFYTFFFSDRELYRPSDVISFWGYTKPYMRNNDPLPQTIRVYLDQGGIDQWVDVPLRPDGTFAGEITVDKVVSSQYSLQAHLYYPDRETDRQMVVLDSIWLEIKEFEKPTFVLTAQPAKPLFSSPEEVEVQATLTFYDGTPVPDFPLELEVMNLQDGNVQEVKKAKTDATGAANFRFRPDAGIGQQEFSNTPRTSYCTVLLAGDGEVVRKPVDYRYQAAGLVTDAQSRVINDQTVELTMHTSLPRGDVTKEQLMALGDSRSDYQMANTLSYNHKLYQVLAGKPINVGLQGQAEIAYTDLKGAERTETFPLSAVTAGGLYRQNLKLEVPCDPKYNVGVALQISCVDDNLNLIATNWNFNTIQPVYEPANEKSQVIQGYSLSVRRNQQTQPMPVQLNYMGYNDLQVEMGDLLTLQLCKDGVPVPNQGRLFYQLIQENPIDQKSITADSFQLREILDYAQSVHLVAAYFDGKTVHPVTNTALRLSLSSVELDVQVTADKTQYRPGETVQLQMQVRDQKGNPVSGSLCVSVVDEAVFALREQYLDVVGDLYSQVGFSSVYVQKYTTATGDLQEQYTGADGGKGDGGIDAYDLLRDQFKDTAYFYDTRTDANGVAQLSFPLPDNITSWRVTTVSVGGNLYGGMDKQNIITTIPFFSKPVITSKYLAGDEVVMLTQGHGTSLEESAQISYQIRLQGNDIDRTVSATGKAFQPVRISLGQLEAGEYTVASTAAYAGYRDTVVLPLTVIPSNLEMVVNRKVDPQQLSSLKITRYPVTLRFYDKEHEGFYQNLSSLLTHFCNRADQRLSRYVAKTAMKRYFPTDQIPRYIAENGSYLGSMQRKDGGISWYPDPASSSDPTLTVRVLLAVGPEPFSASRMRQYLQEVLTAENVAPLERAIVYAGLASFEPETVKEIDLLLREELPMQERLYYLLGLACGGDTVQAQKLYERDVAPYLQVVGNGKRMVYHERMEADRALSAQAWLLATKLQHPDADAFARFFAQDQWGIDVIFERMVYVNDYQKTIQALEPIRYTQNGATKELSTGVSGQASLLLTRAALEKLQFTSIPSQMTTRAYYIGEPSDMEMAPSEDISIVKRVTAQEDGSYLTTIEVELSENAPVGSYDISDWIPSNMRYFSLQNGGGAQMEQELQKLYFTLYRHSELDDHFTISYITRKTFEAKTMLDRTYIIHADSGSYNFTERQAFPA